MLLLRASSAPLVLIAHGGAVVRRRARAVSALVFRHVLGFAGADSSLAAVRLRLPRRARHRLQHLPDDPGPRGGRRRSAPGAGALVGLAATGGVITSAGLVLAGTFAVLGTMPMVAFAEIGVRGGARRPARHAHRPLRARHRAQPRLAVGCGGRVPSRGKTATWTRRTPPRPRTRRTWSSSRFTDLGGPNRGRGMPRG